MKVLQVINSLNSGGAEKLVSDLCIAYIQKGIDVELCLLSGKKTVFMDRVLDSSPNLKIHALGGAKAIYSPGHILKIRRLLNSYDIVHVHLFPAFYWVGFASLIPRIKAKLFYTEHNTTNRRRNHPILKRVDKIIYQRYTKVISISEQCTKT